MPGAARGANGVVHINGDHGVINYMIDGVALPQELNRDIGGEINLNDLSFVDLIEGAYPAQYGLRFGSVFNMATRAGTGPAGFDGYASFGSYTRRAVDDRLSRAARGRRRLRHRAQRPAVRRAGSIRRTSTRRTTMRARRISSRASRCRPAETTSPTSRSSTVTARFRFPTTSQRRAGRHRRQRDASRYVPSRAVSPRDRRHAVRSRSARRSKSRGFKTSAIRRTTSPTARRSTSRPAVRKRRHADRLRRRARPIRTSCLPTTCALFARRQAHGDRLHHAGRLHAELRAAHTSRPARRTISRAC